MKVLFVVSSWMILASSAIYASVSSTQKKEEPLKGAPIRQEMGGLFATISDLLPLVLNKAAFEDKKNMKVIAEDMNRLSSLSHKMTESAKRFADSDPSIPYIADRFAEDIRFAIEMWNTGDREVSRKLLRNATDYCISCHTRTGKGMHFSDVIQSSQFRSMPALSKAEYLAATRQFEDALKQYEHVLVDKPLAKMDPGAWDLAVRKMLAITVRVQKDPSLTLEMISRIQDNPDSMPPNLRGDIAEWRVAAKQWTAEKPQPAMTDEQKFAQAEQLIAEADQWVKQAPGSALIQHMRASAILHELLGHVRGGDHYQKMLYAAARSSEYLRDLNMWTLQDTYYEGCIRNGQNKDLSQKCLTGLESSMLRTYGVASRAGLPDYPRNQLDALAKLIH